MPDIVELLKLVGGVFGLATGLFVVADRLLLFRPHVTWGRTEHNVCVVVRNVAQETIVFEKIVVQPDGWALAWGGSLRDTIEAAAKAIKFENEDAKPMTFVLSADSERSFDVVSSSNVDSNGSGPQIIIHWRFCRDRWLPQLPVKLSADARFWNTLKNARS